MGNVIKLRRRRRPPRDQFGRERRLRILAKRLGYELVKPWCAEERNIPGFGPYVLVRHGTGISLREVEEILRKVET